MSGTHVSTEIVENSSDCETFDNDERDENDCDTAYSYDHFTTPEQSTSPVNVDVDCPSTPKRKRRKLIKSEDDLIPLPNPFPLPKHFRADVEAALANKKMTMETTAAFYSAIASSMLVFKKYPTPEDYITVGRSIVQKYDFLSQPVGTPYVSFHYNLKLIFKS